MKILASKEHGYFWGWGWGDVLFTPHPEHAKTFDERDSFILDVAKELKQRGYLVEIIDWNQDESQKS